ncbi:MAG: hypothetical protein H6706_21320 [Myxococcales bacterium]|nr:hypothetical protein [Myxococcales bacterium]
MRRHLLALLVLAAPAGCTPSGADPVDAQPADAAPTDAGPGCDGALDCEDDDPCTTAVCEAGRCVIGRPEGALLIAGDPIPVASGPTALALAGDELYIGLGAAGLEVWDLAGFPAPPVLRLARHPEGDEGAVDHLAVAADRVVIGEAAGVVRALERGSGAPVGAAWRAADQIEGVVYQGGRVVVASYAKGVEVVQPGDWSDPSRIGRADTRGRAQAVARAGAVLAVADGLAGLALLDLTPTGPVLRRDALLDTSGRAVGVAIRGDRVLLAEGPAGASVVTLAPAGPRRDATFLLAGSTVGVGLLAPDRGVVATSEGEVALVDLRQPAAPRVWLRAPTAAPVRRVQVDGARFAVARDDAVQVFELVCPTTDDAGAAGDAGP